jgi:hypothetical protein
MSVAHKDQTAFGSTPFSTTPVVMIGSIALPLVVVIASLWFVISMQKDAQVMAKDVVSIEKRVCANEIIDGNQRAQIDKLEVVLDQIAVDVSEIKGYLKSNRNMP